MGCMATAPTGNDNNKKKETNNKGTKKRSGSMQYIWGDSWRDVIEDRSAKRMKLESELTESNKSFNEDNCVKRAIFVMNIYKFWNDRKHIELDIDHIVEVITTELDNYSSQQMIRDFKHCKISHSINDLYDLFQTKCKNCGGDECPVLKRQKNDRNDDDINKNINNDDVQRTSTFTQIKPRSLRLMKILDDYHCYFLHKIDDIQADDTIN